MRSDCVSIIILVISQWFLLLPRIVQFSAYCVDPPLACVLCCTNTFFGVSVPRINNPSATLEGKKIFGSPSTKPPRPPPRPTTSKKSLTLSPMMKRETSSRTSNQRVRIAVPMSNRASSGGSYVRAPSSLLLHYAHVHFVCLVRCVCSTYRVLGLLSSPPPPSFFLQEVRMA